MRWRSEAASASSPGGVEPLIGRVEQLEFRVAERSAGRYVLVG